MKLLAQLKENCVVIFRVEKSRQAADERKKNAELRELMAWSQWVWRLGQMDCADLDMLSMKMILIGSSFVQVEGRLMEDTGMVWKSIWRFWYTD